MKKRYMLIIDVEDTCKGCPHYEEDDWDNELTLYCNHPDKKEVIDKVHSNYEKRPGWFIFEYDYPKIPDDCPLPDIEEK